MAPLATVTDDGAVTASLLLASVTIAPSAGAAAVSVTVPVTVSPPAIVVADSERPLNAGVLVVLGDDGDEPHAAIANVKKIATIRETRCTVEPAMQSRGRARTAISKGPLHSGEDSTPSRGDSGQRFGSV